MRIALGSDHAGYRLKEMMKNFLMDEGHKVTDFGAHDENSVDYPDIAVPLARSVAEGEHERGILVCSSGVGMSICANKVRGVRAALCHDTFSARRAREHTDANILCLGEWVVGRGTAQDIVNAFVTAQFQRGRHARRVRKIAAFESGTVEAVV